MRGLRLGGAKVDKLRDLVFELQITDFLVGCSGLTGPFNVRPARRQSGIIILRFNRVCFQLILQVRRQPMNTTAQNNILLRFLLPVEKRSTAEKVLKCAEAG